MNFWMYLRGARPKEEVNSIAKGWRGEPPREVFMNEYEKLAFWIGIIYIMTTVAIIFASIKFVQRNCVRSCNCSEEFTAHEDLSVQTL